MDRKLSTTSAEAETQKQQEKRLQYVSNALEEYENVTTPFLSTPDRPTPSPPRTISPSLSLFVSAV